jgi:hypothetical protein
MPARARTRGSYVWTPKSRRVSDYFPLVRMLRSLFDWRNDPPVVLKSRPETLLSDTRDETALKRSFPGVEVIPCRESVDRCAPCCCSQP